MNAIACTLAALALLLADSARSADWQLALKLNAGFAEMADVTHRGTLGTGERIGIDVDGELKKRRTEDATAGAGFGIGRKAGDWLLEAEYVWRYRTDWDATAPTPTIGSITNLFTNVQTQTWMLNAARIGGFSPRWGWEAGVGAGVVLNRMQSDHIERAVSGVRRERRVERTNTRTRLAWNAFAGVNRSIGGQRRPWRMGLRYRYIALGKLHAGPFDGRAAELWADHGAHELQLALIR